MNYRKIYLFSLFLLLSQLSNGQEILNKYIEEGLANNLVVKEKNVSLEKSLLALQDAKSYFLPSVEFNASYNLANGGRTIDIPLGDLLNGVYGTLNQLTQSNSFPQLENVSEQFLPNNFYDARVRVSMPIINPDLRYQKQIRENQLQVSSYDLDIYKANLIEDIKVAYYNFCTAHIAIEVIESSKELVERNLRDNRSLLENGKGLPSSVLRAESEVENINALMIEAKNRELNAIYYLNFLLNRNLDTSIQFEEQSPDWEEIDFLLQADDLSNRPEILQISTLELIQNTQLNSSKNYWVPRLNTFADFGSQAFDFEFNTQTSAYVFFGLNLGIPIFQGGRNRNQITRSEWDLKNTGYQKELLSEKLNLDLKIAKNDLRTSHAALQTAEKKLESSASYLKLVDRGFKEGANSLIEFIDARNQYTQAALQKTINAYALLKAQAKLERQLQTEINSI
ncbi:TolC family protein [Algoriphagus sp.]|uniref:TolC family protein n=1 Tax=Algoriphagus sp. TaxID=1872435 RepID=UPI0025D0C0A0|nr:TolC family protein [Algoriphagus sp.]